MFFEGLLLLNFKSLILVEIKQLFVLFNVLWKKKTFRTLFFFTKLHLQIRWMWFQQVQH